MTTDLSNKTVKELRDLALLVAEAAENEYKIQRSMLPFDELARRLEEAQQYENRAFQTLNSYGVPRQRARYVANGIDVLVSRMDKEIFDFKRELEEAQQKIVAQQAAMQSAKDELYLVTKDAGFADSVPWNRVRAAKNKLSDELSALAAHDAKVAALAKAEALEEAKEMAEMEANDYNESEGLKYAELKTDAESALNSFAVALGDKAAEYREKAGRKE